MKEPKSRDKSRNSLHRLPEFGSNQLDLKGFSVFELFDQLAAHYDTKVRLTYAWRQNEWGNRPKMIPVKLISPLNTVSHPRALVCEPFAFVDDENSSN